MALRRKPDPELEKLRAEVDGPPNLDTIILNTKRLCTRIHSSYLFDNLGIKLLQQICLYVSATPAGQLYNDWQSFAAELGLTREQIQCIDYDFKGLQDPTYYVLLSFTQTPEATVDKILTAFQRISRIDVINRTIDVLNEFINSIGVLSTTQEIIKPSINPRVPLVLRSLKIVENLSHTSELSSSVKSIDKLTNSHNYGSIVMLTFARDGEKIAKIIADILRGKNPKIGVVILQEQDKHVYSRAEEFVDDCFKQVNYIVPILTDGYINYINNNDTDIKDDIYESTAMSLDVKYIKYIYSLLRYEYVQNKCCNQRVRCIVPDSEISSIIQSDLHPTLQAWFRQSDLDSFAENVLLKKF